EAILRAVALGPDAAARALAIEALRRRAPATTNALLAEIIDDRASLNRLIGAVDADAALLALRAGAAGVHTQGVALPHLVRRGDVEGLRVILEGAYPEPVRLGALEALAQIATPTAQDALAAVAKAEATPKALRKAAWRGLRRSKRAQDASREVQA
ncbi:hypothetical protein KKB55_00600, partial [Myxococcota bacterium]|nr:hypothetical protein [Myxococcota bacterium]